MALLITLIVGALGVVTGLQTGVGQQDAGYKLIFNIVNQLTVWQTDTATQFTSQVYEWFVPIALTLCLGYVMLDMMGAIERAGMQNATPQILIMPMLKFVACWLLMKYGLKLIGYAMDGSNGFVKWIISLQPDWGSYTAAKVKVAWGTSPTVGEGGSVVHSGLLAKIFTEFLPAMISMVGMVVAAAQIAMTVVSFRLDYLIRAMFMPFAIANVAHTGPNGPGISYIKKFIGDMFFMGGVLLVINLAFAVCSPVTSGGMIAIFDSNDAGQMTFQGMVSTMLLGIIGPFAAVGAVGALKQAIQAAFQ